MIFAHEPFQCGMDDGSISHSVNTCFRNGEKTISISLDNSCGRMNRLSRSDMRLFMGASDLSVDSVDCQEVTHIVFSDDDREPTWNVDANLENFQKAWEWLNESR